MTPGEIPDKTPSPTEGKSDGANPFDDDDLYNFGSSSSGAPVGKSTKSSSGQEPLNKPKPADVGLDIFFDGVVGEPEETSDPSAVQAGEPPAEPEAGRPYSLEAWRGRLVDEGRVFTGRVAQSANALQANIDSLNAPGLTEGARNELLFRMGLRRAEMTAATAYIANRYGLLTGDIVAPEDKPQNKQVDDDLGLTKARENATDAVRKWIDYSGNTYRNPRIVETRKRIQDQCKKMIHDPVIDTSDPSNGMVELLHRHSHVNNHDIKYDDERQDAVRYLDFIELINSRNIVTIMWEFGQSLGLSKEARTAILQEPESWMVSESGWTQQDEELPEFLRPKDESQSKGSGQGPSSEPSVAASASGDIPAVTTTQEQAGASGAAVGGAGVEPEQVRTAPGAGVAHAAGQETADGAVTPDAAQTLVPEPAIPPPTPEHASSTPMIVIPLLIPGQGAEGQTEKKKTEAEDTLVIPVEVPGFASPVYVLVQMGSAPAARDLGVRLANIVAARMQQIGPSLNGPLPLTLLRDLVAGGVACYQETMQAYQRNTQEGFIEQYPDMQPEEAKTRAEDDVADQEPHLQPTIIAIGTHSESGLVNIASAGGDRTIVHQLADKKPQILFQSLDTPARITRTGNMDGKVETNTLSLAPGSRLVILPQSGQLELGPVRRAMQGEPADVHSQLRELISQSRGDAASDTTAMVIDIPGGKSAKRQQLAQKLRRTGHRIGDAAAAAGDHLLSHSWWSVSAGGSTDGPQAEEKTPPPPPQGVGEPPPPNPLDGGVGPAPTSQSPEAVQAEVSVPGGTPALSETTAETSGQPAVSAPETQAESPEKPGRFDQRRSVVTAWHRFKNGIVEIAHSADARIKKLTGGTKTATSLGMSTMGLFPSVGAMLTMMAYNLKKQFKSDKIQSLEGKAKTKEQAKLVGRVAGKMALGFLVGWAERTVKAFKHTKKVLRENSEYRKYAWGGMAAGLVFGGISEYVVAKLISGSSLFTVSGKGVTRMALLSLITLADSINDRMEEAAQSDKRLKPKDADTPLSHEQEELKAKYLARHAKARTFISAMAATATLISAVGQAVNMGEMYLNYGESFLAKQDILQDMDQDGHVLDDAASQAIDRLRQIVGLAGKGIKGESDTTPTAEALTTTETMPATETSVASAASPTAHASDTPAPPTVSPTPPPTHTMMPTASPTAHFTPTHTPTPEPTDTPTAEPTDMPTAEPTPAWPEGLQHEIDIDGDKTADYTIEDYDHDGDLELVKDGVVIGHAADMNGDGKIDTFFDDQRAVAFCNWDDKPDIDAVYAKEDTDPFTGEKQDLFRGADDNPYESGQPEQGIFSHDVLFNQNGEPVMFAEGSSSMHNLANQVAFNPAVMPDVGARVVAVETPPAGFRIMPFQVDGKDVLASPSTGEWFVGDKMSADKIGFDLDGDKNVDILLLGGKHFAVEEYDAKDTSDTIGLFIPKTGSTDVLTPPQELTVANIDGKAFVQANIDNDSELETIDVTDAGKPDVENNQDIIDKVNQELNPGEVEDPIGPGDREVTGITIDGKDVWLDNDSHGLFTGEPGNWTQVGFVVPGMGSDNVDLIRVMNDEGEWEWHQVGDIENLRELADKVNTAISGDKIEVADLEVDGNDMVVGQLEDGSFVNLTETDGAVQPALFDDPAVANAVNAAWTAAHPGTGAAGSDDKTSEGYPKTFLGRDGKEHNIIYGAKGGAWGLLMQKIAEKHKDDASWDGNDTVHAAGHAWNELKPVVAPFAGDRPIIGQGEDLQDWLDRVMRAVPEDDKDDVLEDIQAALGKAGVTGVSLSGSSEG